MFGFLNRVFGAPEPTPGSQPRIQIRGKKLPKHLEELDNALWNNYANGTALLTNPRNTSFAGVREVEDSHDEELAVIDSTKSIPTHY